MMELCLIIKNKQTKIKNIISYNLQNIMKFYFDASHWLNQ